MSNVRIVVGIMMALGLLGASGTTVAMAESNEFIKVKSKVTSATTGAYIILSGGNVYCESGKGTGLVASATDLKVENSYAKCKSFFGKEAEKEAKVSTCALEFNPEDTVALKKGCKIESGSCVVEPASTALGNEAEYLGLKEEGELATEALAGAEGIEYKVNEACKTAGLSAGKATLVTSMELQDVAPRIPRDIRVVGAGAGTMEKTMVLKNIPPTVVTFKFPGPGGQREIKCNKMEAKGKTSREIQRNAYRTFEGFSFDECKTDLLAAGAERSLDNGGNMTTTNCSYTLAAYNRTTTTLWPGGAGNIDKSSEQTCLFEASVTEIPMPTCTIKFLPNQSNPDVWLTNVAGPPNTVTVKYAETNSEFYRPSYESENCAAINRAGRAEVTKGIAKLEIEGGTNVEVV